MFISFPFWITALSLPISFVSATPTRLIKKRPFLEHRPSTPLSKRQTGNMGNVGGYGLNDLPTCDSDPSFASGPSRFQDGEGTSQVSGCDNGKGGNEHCWTDTFMVFWEFEYGDWTSTGMGIDCADSTSCSQENVDLNQTCTENKITTEGSIKGTIESKLPEWFEGWVPSFNFVSAGSSNELESERICTETSATGSCSWDDKACHGIWTVQRNRRVWGYQRRTCTTPRSGTNMPNTSPRPDDGKYTVGMQDISIIVPDSTVVGCAALCDDRTYPDPVPANPGTTVAISG